MNFHILELFIRIKVLICGDTNSEVIDLREINISGEAYHLPIILREGLWYKEVVPLDHVLSSLTKIYQSFFDVEIMNEAISGIDQSDRSGS